ncbi:MAG: hypothetical protein ACI8TX_003278 [Hyphomicrobiaceae bacterium]
MASGALLAEGGLLVPFWQSLEPAEFLRWYQRNASLLLRFFTPLEVIPTVLVVVAASMSVARGLPGARLLALAAVLAIVVLLSFPLYFQAANASFADATIELDAVGAELVRWSCWHWGRTVLAIVSFACALVAFGDVRRTRPQ